MPDCLAILLPPIRGTRRTTSTACTRRRRGWRPPFPGRAWMGLNLLHRAFDDAHRATRRRSRLAARLADRGARPRVHARALAQTAAGHAERDPPGQAGGRVRLRAGAERRAAPARAPAPGQSVSAAGAGRNRAHRARCARSRSTNCATNTRTNWCRPATRRRAICAQETCIGAHRRFPRRHPGQGAGADRARAGADRRAALRALLSDRVRHRALRPLAAHPVPGPRLGRQFGGLLLPAASPRSIRRAATCCSSASSRASATSRPTSTSTSSTSGARK